MLFNKRLTGYANFVWRRGRVHRREYLEAVLAAAAEADHVVVTGDITNLAFESEFKEARRLLDDLARTVEVTVIPGNHDLYLPRTQRDRSFPRHFGPFLESDLPDLGVDLPAGRYPCVKLRGPAAIIALSSAVPRPPFVAAGYLGHAQLEALAEVLRHPEVRSRTPVILVHHPPVDSRCRLAQLRDGLIDGASFRAALAPLTRGLVLFGHLHVR
ncbi:MAG TPA: metallophosphoesterase, partial [Bacteroidota bacterium]